MSFKTVSFSVFHGGSFQRLPAFGYAEGEKSIIKMDPDYIALGDLKEEVAKLGYSEDRIKSIYFTLPNLPLEDSLVELRTDEQARQLILLSMTDEYVRLYIVHDKDDVMSKLNRENEQDNDDENGINSPDELDEEYNPGDEESVDGNSGGDDDDAVDGREKMRKIKEMLATHRQNLEDEEDDNNNGLIAPGEPKYFDSDDASSPNEDSDELSDQADNEACTNYRRGKGKKKKKRSGMYRFKKGADFAVGAQFKDKDACRLALDDYRIKNGYNIIVARSSKKRLQGKCNGANCTWAFWASPLQKELTWVCKSMSKKHTCIPFSYAKKQRYLSSNWLAKEYHETFMLLPTLSAREFKKLVDKDMDTDVSETMCNNAKNKALVAILGDYRVQFGQIRKYLFEVYNRNPGTNIKIATRRNEIGECVMKDLYICVGSLRKGFLEGCRKVISLDGCFMKGPWNAQILAAVGRDANNQMYPVAWGIAERENKESWTWFVELMRTDLCMNTGQGWTIISDQQKGLVDAITNLLPDVEHRLCARHVYANLRKHWRGLDFKIVFWKLAKAANQSHFTQYRDELIALDPEAWKFIEKKEPRHFCRLFFREDACCDSVDNNMAEIFNSTIVEARFQPVVTMLDTIYNTVMVRVATRQKWLIKLDTPIAPRIMKKLTKNQAQSVYWQSQNAGNGVWGVRHGLEGFFVSLNNKSCSCGQWQVSGIPCMHAIAVFRDNGIVPHTYVSNWYSTDFLSATYGHTVHPINGIDMWVDPPHGDPIVAPPFKLRKRGLKFKRIPEVGEKRSSGRVSKAGGEITCSICKQAGHNRKTCPNRPNTQTSTSRETTRVVQRLPPPVIIPIPPLVTNHIPPPIPPSIPSPKSSIVPSPFNSQLVFFDQAPEPLCVVKSKAAKIPVRRATYTKQGIRVMFPKSRKNDQAPFLPPRMSRYTNEERPSSTTNTYNYSYEDVHKNTFSPRKNANRPTSSVPSSAQRRMSGGIRKVLYPTKTNVVADE